MPYYISIGVSYEKTMESCPKELEPYDKAHTKSIEEKDRLMHMWFGNYALSAFGVVLDHCISGKKAKTEYIKKPITIMAKEENRGISEDELQGLRELFVAKLEVMKTNFELNHKDGKK